MATKHSFIYVWCVKNNTFLKKLFLVQNPQVLHLLLLLLLLLCFIRRFQLHIYIFRLKYLSVLTTKVDIPATRLITGHINVACIVTDSSYHLSLQTTFLP